MKFARTFAAIAFIAVVPLAAEAAEETGFRYDGKTFLGENLPGPVRQQLYKIDEKLNEQRKQLFDRAVIQKYLEERAAAESKSAEQLEQELLAAGKPDEASLRAFYDENKERIPKPFEQVRNDIEGYLQQQQVQKKANALLEQIKAEKGYETILSMPEAPLFDITVEGYPFKGGANAKVTIVEFADYQCPHCKTATGIVAGLIKKFGDKVRVVYRDFPVNRSGISRKIAIGAVCADQQGRFWNYHDLAFERQDTLTDDSPSTLAADLSLDTDQFEDCLKAPQTEAKVAKSQAEATEMGVTGTPTFFVNGRQLHVHGDIEQPLIKAVEKAFAQAS